MPPIDLPLKRPLIDLDNPPDLVIFDFDGTLFDTQTSIAHCIAQTFAAMAPDAQPSIDDIQSVIASGAGLEDTFRRLVLDDDDTAPGMISRDLNNWVARYRAIYAEEGLSKVIPYPGAMETLQRLHQHHIKTVISTNKGRESVLSVLTTWDMLEYIDFVVGDTPAVKRKPDPQSYDLLIAPKCGTKDTDSSVVIVIGDTLADIEYARNIGAFGVWAKYGYGNVDEIQKMDVMFTIDSLPELFDE